MIFVEADSFSYNGDGDLFFNMKETAICMIVSGQWYGVQKIHQTK